VKENKNHILLLYGYYKFLPLNLIDKFLPFLIGGTNNHKSST
jgi:hypothetical protein